MNTAHDNRELLRLISQTFNRAIELKFISAENMERIRCSFSEINAALDSIENDAEKKIEQPLDNTQEETAKSCNIPSSGETVACEAQAEKKHVCSSTFPDKSDEAVAANELDLLVKKIQNSSCPTENMIVDSDLLRYVMEKNLSRCKGVVAYEGLWNGESGWKSDKELAQIVSFLWHKIPEIFEPFDDEREITGNKSQWNRPYLDCQRNFLRHNFSIKRLCHLILVYTYLNPPQVKCPSDSYACPTKQGNVRGGNSFNEGSVKIKPKNSRSRKLFFFLGCGVVVVIVALLVSMFVTKRCYSDEELMQYVTKSISEQKRLSLEKHISHCKKCQNTVVVFQGQNNTANEPSSQTGSVTSSDGKKKITVQPSSQDSEKMKTGKKTYHAKTSASQEDRMPVGKGTK